MSTTTRAATLSEQERRAALEALRWLIDAVAGDPRATHEGSDQRQAKEPRR